MIRAITAKTQLTNINNDDSNIYPIIEKVCLELNQL